MTTLNSAQQNQRSPFYSYMHLITGNLYVNIYMSVNDNVSDEQMRICGQFNGR